LLSFFLDIGLEFMLIFKATILTKMENIFNFIYFKILRAIKFEGKINHLKLNKYVSKV